jgi:hypothetical protein
MFRPGVVTAADVILSLGEQGELSYDLDWVPAIGLARVQNYYVTRINDDEQGGRCGFVYEAGPIAFRGFRGNHIHLPTDARVIRSPEYVEFFRIGI